MTINLNASALTNQGMVLAGQFGLKVTRVPDHPLVYTNDFPNANIPVDPANRGAVWVVNDLPETTDEVFAKDPHAVRQPARRGVYMPLKFNDPESLFSPLESTGYSSNNGTSPNIADNPEMANSPIVLVHNGENTWLRSGDPSDGSCQVLTAAGLVNLQTGVVIFNGLSKQASLDVKVVNALEVVADGTSAWTGFMKSAPDSDPGVMRQVHAVQKALPSAHPASANFLGTLLTTIAPTLGRIALGLVGGLVSKWVDRRRPRYVEPELD
jgi:hypothetical protein